MPDPATLRPAGSAGPAPAPSPSRSPRVEGGLEPRRLESVPAEAETHDGAVAPNDGASGTRGSLRQRLVARLVVAVARAAARLPESLLWRLADLAGGVAYRVAPRRRDEARRNLRRIVEWMAARGVGQERYWAAAGNDHALEAVVRSAFRHHVRSYVETILAPRFDARYIRERLLVETPEAVAEGLSVRRPLILLGLHFGAIELPGLFAVQRLGSFTCPMETLDNPGIQEFLVRTRSSVGIELLPLQGAALELRAALRRGDPVGLVGDRDLNGSGVRVELFGAPARLPAAPALLAVESGAPLYVAGVRRAGQGRYRGRMWRLGEAGEGTRRERARALVEAEARSFERIVADAPDQWLAVFHPIWPDLESAANASSGERA